MKRGERKKQPKKPKKNLHFMWFWCKQSLYRVQTADKEETEMKIREIIFN